MTDTQFRYTNEGLCLEALNGCKTLLVTTRGQSNELYAAARFVMAAGLFREIVPDIPASDIYAGTLLESLEPEEQDELYEEVLEKTVFNDRPVDAPDDPIDRFIDVFLGAVTYQGLGNTALAECIQAKSA